MEVGKSNFYNSNRYRLRKLLLMLKKIDLPGIWHEFGNIHSYVEKWEVIEPGDD